MTRDRPHPDPSKRNLTPDQRVLLTNFLTESVDVEIYPPAIRSRIEVARDVSTLILRITAGQDEGGDHDELARLLKSSPHWEKGLLRLPSGTIRIRSEGRLRDWREATEPGDIWIRGDGLTQEQRRTAASLASVLEDLSGRRRNAGRPTGSRLTTKELAALEAIGDDWRSLHWAEGWKLMTAKKAWESDGRGQMDRRARKARAARWHRLLLRATNSVHDQ